MSLEKKTVLDDIIIELVRKSWDLGLAAYDLWKAVVYDKKTPHVFILRKVKKLAEEVKEICEELP